MDYYAGSGAAAGRLIKPVVTVGNFDGLHIGHRAIIDTVVARARELGGPAVAYTFEPHPIRVLRPDQAPQMLTTIEQRLELFEQAGLDAVIVEKFDLEFACFQHLLADLSE